MANITSVVKAHRFITGMVSMAALGILLGAAVGWTGKAERKAAQAADKVNIVSKTTAIRIISTEKTNLGAASVLVVQLQNASDKDIKALTISSGPTWVTKDYLMSEESLSAGAVLSQLIPISSDPSGDFKITFEPAKEFSVVAVLFADGTGDGESRFVNMLVDKREGIRFQAKRILPWLKKLSKSDSNQEQVLSECEAQTLRLPTKAVGSKSVDYEEGLEYARQQLLKKLNEIKEKSHSKQFIDVTSKQDKLTRVFQSLAGS